MSTVKELADAEAERVEGELGTENPEPEPADPEPEPEPEPEQVAAGPTEADLRKFEAENARHERTLAKIVGADFEHFEPCGVCGGVGHVPAASNLDVPFEQDPQTEPCSVCNGYGTTRTGAREPGMVTRACSRCDGRGWKTVAEHPEVQPFVPQVVDMVVTTTEAPANGEPIDPAVAALRARGYIVVDPVAPLAPAGS